MAAVIKSNDENSNIVHSYNNKGETQGQQVWEDQQQQHQL